MVSFCFAWFGRGWYWWYCPLTLGRPFPFEGLADWVLISPSRSASVSMLLRSSRIGLWDILGPGLDLAEALAWSLCCQQYEFSSAGLSVRMGFKRLTGPASSAVIGRRHGRPLEVIPLHVDAGFFESARPSLDSGVFAKMGIAVGQVLACLEKLLNGQRFNEAASVNCSSV